MKTIKYFMLMLVLFAGHPTIAQNSNAATNKVLQEYLGLEKALFNDDSRMANNSATALVKAIKKVKVAELVAGQKTVWTKYNEKLLYNSLHISESKSINHQREHFAPLSDDVYALFQKIKPGITIYRQYCPMKKQYWLNASAPIQNTYYGKEMPDCGKVTETIKGTAQ